MQGGREDAEWVFTRYTHPKPVNRRPLRFRCVATIATVVVLSCVKPALSHVDVQPRLVEPGAIAELRIELPQLRPGAPPERLEVEGPGLETLSTRLQGVVASETRWTARVRTDADAEPGVLPLVLRAVFADGESVEVEDAITVVPPATSDDAFPWAAAAAGTLFAVGLAAAALIFARRQGRA
jgi:hypothetical protein